MLNCAIFIVSLIVFVSALLINLGLLIDPALGSDAVESALSIMLLITIFSMFVCSTPNWKLVSLKKEPSWSRIVFEYAIPLYYLLITVFVIFYHFTKTLELAAMLLLFSGLALRWSYTARGQELKVFCAPKLPRLNDRK